MELTRDNLKGSMVALVTPFRHGKVDERSLKRLLDFQLSGGTDVIVPCGTTGEASTLSYEEHRGVMSFVVDYVRGRVPVICGAGSNSTEEALDLVRHAKKSGADGVLVVTPYYNRPTQEGLYRHYEFLAKKVNIPIILYNVPSRTGVSIAPETVARLAKLPNIIGIKEASGSLEQASRIVAACNLALISGEDSLTLPLLSIGATGVISVVANVVPKQVHEMVEAYLSGSVGRAKKLHHELFSLSKILFIETNPIPAKTALALMGMISGELRLPLCEMGTENRKKLVQLLKQRNLLRR
ncbi:MAG: 4-hydroxy-tetrahydrodipicolinate synthase [Omnitrophica bacterium RIFCSPLOWO2_12_FULL_50_11]|nr:MAG: 4-hydroxy-tetrahydrodipicolinate synthase [Omnitrophica bacterium RIFCSPLOWO2_12_FULL_50_11]